MQKINILNRSRVGRARPLIAAVAAAGLLVVAVVTAQAAYSAEAPGAASKPMVNINTATADELQVLPGIGASRADLIVALRKERGRFKRVDELLEVRGIGPAMMEKLRGQVSLSGPTRLPGATSKK